MAHDDPTGPVDLLERDASILTPEALAPVAEYAAPDNTADPTGGAQAAPVEDAAEAQFVPSTIPTPAIPVPLPLPTRNVTGRYKGQVGAFQLEVRADFDGAHPLNMFSGDFYSVSGAVTSYLGSFTVESPVITRTATQIVARGLGKFSFSAGAPVVQITIPRRRILLPAAPATVQFFTTGGQPGATYVCAFEAVGLRRVLIETDRVSDVTTPVFTSYNTGAQPSGGPARSLSVVSAYAEAGIEMVPTAGSDVIDIGEAGVNHTWSDAELHASMVRHFSQYRNQPQWAVWQLVCQTHDLGPGLYGIMFDQAGLQRQGCAVFHNGIGGTTPDKLRLQLYTYVHELGHSFNLLHSWQKSLANPPGVNRPSALSWMNYPWGFPAGPAAFWSAFGFQFDQPELAHLRHAFRNKVIMGGDPFATNSALIDPQAFADPIRDDSGFQLDIEPHKSGYMLGEPVILKLALSLTDRRGKVAHPHLNPKTSLTSLAICKPNGDVVAYEPFIDRLMDSEPRFLAGGETIEDTVYIGYGGDGLYFDRPGTYKLRAIYHAPDGSPVFSNVAQLRVRHPVTQAEEELADLLIGDEQGALFYLVGSDSEALASGNRAFDIVLDKHAKSPLADYVQAARGVNAARTFVTVDDANPERARVRKPDLDEAASLVAAATAPDSQWDDLSKAQFLNKLAREQRRAGDEKAASASNARAVEIHPRAK